MNIFGFGAPEILLILFLLLLFFGKSKLPGLAKSIGESFRELKASLTGDSSKTSKSEESPTSPTDNANEPK